MYGNIVVDMPYRPVYSMLEKNKTVTKFLNRMLAMSLRDQKLLFTYFSDTLVRLPTAVTSCITFGSQCMFLQLIDGTAAGTGSQYYTSTLSSLPRTDFHAEYSLACNTHRLFSKQHYCEDRLLLVCDDLCPPQDAVMDMTARKYY